MNIGQKIKTLRENNNISIEELAKKINSRYPVVKIN